MELSAFVLCTAVVLGSFRLGGMCVYVLVGICIGVCHPSGVEQLFYQQASESFPGLTKTSRYLHLLSQRMNK